MTTRSKEIVAALGLACLAAAWSWWGHLYDLRFPALRVGVTALSLGASYGLMWIGLWVCGVPARARAGAAGWAVAPWNGLLLSQLAYVGYLFIPLEILASAWLLRRRTPLPCSRALLLAVATRAIVFVVVSAAAASLRTWPR